MTCPLRRFNQVRVQECPVPSSALSVMLAQVKYSAYRSLDRLSCTIIWQKGLSSACRFVTSDNQGLIKITKKSDDRSNASSTSMQNHIVPCRGFRLLFLLPFGVIEVSGSAVFL